MGGEQPAHVRSSGPRVRHLLVEGVERSATLRRIVERVQDLPGVVYIEPAVGLSQRGMGGCLLFMVGGSTKDRYLRVLIDLNASNDRLIEVIAHELQHALEVLERPDVVDGATMEALFGRIGIRGPQSRRVMDRRETTAAQDVSRAVAQDLRLTRAAR